MVQPPERAVAHSPGTATARGNSLFEQTDTRALMAMALLAGFDHFVTGGTLQVALSTMATMSAI